MGWCQKRRRRPGACDQTVPGVGIGDDPHYGYAAGCAQGTVEVRVPKAKHPAAGCDQPVTMTVRSGADADDPPVEVNGA